MNKNHKTIKREEIYKGKIIDVVLDTVILPNGKEAKREIVFHDEAAAVIPVTKENKIIMVKQYRKAVEEEMYEIPAGLLNKNEDPKKAALRELEEETGYIPNKIHFLFTMYVSPGFCNEKIHIYMAQDLQLNKQNLDEDEFVEIFEFEMEEVEEMILNKKITDGKTIAAYYCMKSQLQTTLKE